MPLPTTVLRTKIIPPRNSPRTLIRPRLTEALIEAVNYRLTLVQAGAGYGKTSSLAALSETDYPLIWYQIMQEDSDPLVFLLHLCHATRQAVPDLADLPIPLLEAWDGTSSPLPTVRIFDQYLNSLSTGIKKPTLLVLDDIHHAASSTEIAHLIDRLVGLAPPDLHILLSGRPPLSLPNLSRWRSQGMVYSIDRSTLAFTAVEIAELFSQQYGYELTSDEAEVLYNATEGWAIALQLVWQNLRTQALASVDEVLANQAASLDSLFHILATEVFEGQPADVQEFLRISAILREMTPEACDALRGASDSAAMLAYLRRLDLFVVDLGDSSSRYHHIFHSFLQQFSDPRQRCEWHRTASSYYLSKEDFNEAIYHLYHAMDWEGAASLLDSFGTQLLTSGRLDTLSYYLGGLTPEILQQHPPLLFYLGELARLHSRFQEAVGWYQQAEAAWRDRGHLEGVSRALRGQARVFLDTVNPSYAEELLQKSIRISDDMEGLETRVRLYELLAENKLNSGHVEEAENLRKQADALRAEGPSDSQLLFRVLLRTGRLEESCQKLAARAEAERLEPVPTPRAHRETLLLLSLVYALKGMAKEAHQTALEGTQRGSDLQSPFITAVGYIRQGHALLLLPEPDRYDQARQAYMKAIQLSQDLSVLRLKVEACWGLCRVYGYTGNLQQALQTAQEGIEIARQAGDEWIASLVRVSVGASMALAGRYETAVEWLSRAAQGFQECSDSFGRSAARMWLCYCHWKQGTLELLSQLLPDVLSKCQENAYDFLWTKPTLIGPDDERILIPLLILARQRSWQTGYVEHLLSSLGLSGVITHPGYQLQVSTLGTFQTKRGDQPIPANSWRRTKARQLFQILLTYRSAPLDRDQILEYLWPELDPVSAQRNFKVTLNTLYHVLEPERASGADSAYILREGTTYTLRPGADLWLDAEAFAAGIGMAESYLEKDQAEAIRLYEGALVYYKGEYLPEALYETWAAAERERLAVLFLRSADRLSEIYLDQRRYEDTIDLCYRILSADNCWERAYRHIMLAYDALGNRGQVARVYQRCVQVLRDELEVDPAVETVNLFQRLKT